MVTRAQWWWTLGRDYELRAERTTHEEDGRANGLCRLTYGHDEFYILAPDVDAGYWWDLDETGRDERAIACYLIATMIDAGDL